MNYPNYYAVIPAVIRYAEGIPPNAKLLYGEIVALTNKKGYCFATNKYFAELYNVSEGIVSSWINILAEKKFIKNELIYKSNSKQIIARHLYILAKPKNKLKDKQYDTDEPAIKSPNYYAVIPATVRYDKQLPANAKLLYGEISALANKYGYCNATNNYFAKLYKVNKRTIINWLNSLLAQNYISHQIIQAENTQQIIERQIYIEDVPSEIFLNRGSEIFLNRGSEIFLNRGSEKNMKGNNTRFINTSIEHSGGESTTTIENIAAEIINYLNRCLHTKYKATSNETLNLITKRISEGYTLDDFKEVIDRKHKQWGNSEMAKYLRPKTLFGNNFESYLNELEPQIKTKPSKFHNCKGRQWDFAAIEKMFMDID